jgi:hypothetical protein
VRCTCKICCESVDRPTAKTGAARQRSARRVRQHAVHLGAGQAARAEELARGGLNLGGVSSQGCDAGALPAGGWQLLAHQQQRAELDGGEDHRQQQG